MKLALNAEVAEYRKWLLERDKSGATILKYTHIAQSFLDFSGKTLSSITKEQVVAYVEHLSRQRQPSTINACIISLNTLFKYLENDALRQKTLKIQRKMSLDNILSKAEYKRLIAAAKTRSVRLYLLVRVLASSGIRAHELQFITADVLKTGKTYVHGKGKAREIIIAHDLCQELQVFCVERQITGSDVVFHGRKKDKLLDKARIWRELKEIARLADVPPEKAHAHNFRHFFAKQYLAKYHDIVDLADVLGHNSVETTRIYTRTSGQEKRDRINALEL